MCLLPAEAAALLGTDFLEGRSAHIHFEDGKMSFDDTVKDNRAQGDTFGELRVLRVFTPGKEGHSPQPMWQMEKTKDEWVLESRKIEEPTSHSRTWLVKALKNVVLAPWCKQVAVARLETEKAQNLPPLVYVEPAQIPIEGTFPARTLS